MEATTYTVVFLVMKYVIISSHHGMRVFKYPFALCLALGQKQQQQTRVAPPERDWCTQRVDFSVCLSYYLLKEKYTLSSSASHRHYDLIDTKLLACRRLIVVLPRQIRSARRKFDRQNSSGPKTTAACGPTSTAISARGRPDKSLLLGTCLLQNWNYVSQEQWNYIFNPPQKKTRILRELKLHILADFKHHEA